MIRDLDVSARNDPRFKNIKLILLDVDGVLTDGSLQHFPGQGWTRRYHVYDGYGIRLIQKLGIPVGILTGALTTELQDRLKVLGIKIAKMGSEDKLRSLMEVHEETKIPLDQIVYMGDELFDIPALKAVGISVTVPGAAPEVKAICDYVTQRPGGAGAVRDLIDCIRYANNLHEA